MRLPALGVVLLLLMSGAGCATEDSASKVGAEASAEPSASSACDEVVKGIAAFNAGDFEGTVSHFEAAVPLAMDEVSADPTAATEDLLEAVRYYAELAPEDYSEAAATSPEFAKYKTITLGQCASDGGDAGDEEPPGQLA